MQHEYTKAMKAISRIKAQTARMRETSQEPGQGEEAAPPMEPAPPKATAAIARRRSRQKQRALAIGFAIASTLASLVCIEYIGWLRYGEWRGEGPIRLIAHACGTAPIIFVVCLTIGMVPRKENPARKWLLFALVFPAWAVLAYADVYEQGVRVQKQVDASKLAANQLSETMADFVSDPTGTSSGANGPAGQATRAPRHGTWATITSLVSKMVERAREQSARIQAAWTELDSPQIVNTTLYAGPRDLQGAIERVTAFQGKLDKSEEAWAKVIQEMDSQILQLSPDDAMSEQSLREFTASYFAGREGSAADISKLFALSRDYASTLKSILEFVLKNQGRYRIVSGEFDWDQSVDVRPLADAAAKLDTLAASLDALGKEIAQKQQGVLDDLRRVAH
jgi:hypothetical protein